jgi:hypothetical protein
MYPADMRDACASVKAYYVRGSSGEHKHIIIILLSITQTFLESNEQLRSSWNAVSKACGYEEPNTPAAAVKR